MDDHTLEATIRSYVQQVIHMSVATASDNRPRVFEVHFAFDDDLNLYWMSSQRAQHSVDIKNNIHVSGTIVTHHFLNQKPRGVAFDGDATVIDVIDEDSNAYKAYVARFADRGAGILSTYEKPEGARLYKIAVEDFYLIDGLGDGPPVKHHLKWGGKE